MSKTTIGDIKVGMSANRLVLIQNDDIENFGRLTKDSNPLHMDLEFAKETMFKQVNAQGSLLSSYIVGVVGSKFPGKGWMCLGVDSTFNLPVFPGDSVKITVVVDKIVENLGIVILDGKMANMEGGVMCRAKITVKELSKC